jgi:hypothetical protein
MLSKFEGPTGFYGPTVDSIVRPITAILVLSETAFASLELMFPVVDENQADIEDLVFQPLTEIYNVKSFKLTSGSILVCFRT